MNSSEQNNIAVAFDQVSYKYKSDLIGVNNITVAIKKGEAVALCGANGSGKTTLLKLAAGLLVPFKGDVFIEGELQDKKSRMQLFRKVGFLFQDSDDQLFCPTVEEDVAYGLKNMDIIKEERDKRVQESLKIMKIEHLTSRPIHQLSGGEKKRVALAGLVAMKNRILVMDEPTSGLDPSGSRSLLSLFNELNKKHGYTLIIATHEMNRIPEFADRMVILKEGNLLADGNVSDILKNIPLLTDGGLEAPAIAQYFFEKNGKTNGNGRFIPLTVKEALKNM